MTNANTQTSFSSFFATKEDYLAFKAHWKQLARDRALTATDVALRMLVLGADPLCVMPPTKNPTRIANGALHTCGLTLSLNSLSGEGHAARRRLADSTVAKTAFAKRWGEHGVSDAMLVDLMPRIVAIRSELFA